MLNILDEFQPQMQSWRRHFHQNPEIAFEETQTAAFIAEQLRGWGIAVEEGIGGTGVVGVISGTRKSDHMIGLRADMDALPMTEQNDFAYASQIAGRFHGCGHDGHSSMLLGACWYLAHHGDFPGKICAIFQPAEEGRAGAKAMLEDGLFSRYPCQEVYALHNWPELPVGQVATRAGAMMAAADRFEIVIKGCGGHAAMPHLTRDPMVMAAQLITSLQDIISRRVDPMAQAVLSVTQIQAGEAFNVIPDTVTIGGTIRTLDTDIHQRIWEELYHRVSHFANAYHMSAQVIMHQGYPVTYNHEEQSRAVIDIAQDIFGVEQVKNDPTPSMGAEDFAFMLEKCPGAYVFLGQRDDTHQAGLHHPSYDFNDRILPLGAGLLTALGQRRLTALSS